MHFNHAFDPLARILAESSAPGVRAAAIEAIAHIDTTEAAELLLGLLDHGSPDDRASAARALSGTKASRFIELAKASYAASGAALQGELKRVFSARNITF
ncbi:MAG: HEAT repeat domain-containing protein [Polyangiaceae bacterium]